MATTQNFTKFNATAAVRYGTKFEKLAKGFAPNTHLRQSITKTIEIGTDRYVLRVRAKGPDARAREFGSGLHSKFGPKHKILIRPRNKQYLAFNWELANANIPKLPDGRVLLKEVKHPGVEAANNGKGYLMPAAKAVVTEIRKKYGSEVKASIILDIRQSLRTSNAR